MKKLMLVTALSIVAFSPTVQPAKKFFIIAACTLAATQGAQAWPWSSQSNDPDLTTFDGVNKFVLQCNNGTVINKDDTECLATRNSIMGAATGNQECGFWLSKDPQTPEWIGVTDDMNPRNKEYIAKQNAANKAAVDTYNAQIIACKEATSAATQHYQDFIIEDRCPREGRIHQAMCNVVNVVRAATPEQVKKLVASVVSFFKKK